MGRTFVEVFPDYRVPDQLSYLLSHTEVEQVLMKKKDPRTDHTDQGASYSEEVCLE